MQLKEWYQSKTLWFNVLSAIVMILELLLKDSFIPLLYIPYVTLGIGIVNGILRIFFTDAGIASRAARRARKDSLRK